LLVASDFLLLLLNLLLLSRKFLIAFLKPITNERASASAERATDRRASARVANRCPNNRASSTAYTTPNQGAFFPRS
jgi:hypothetical protein